MARRPTIKDIAREAGVSTATVDRVLNGRAEVRGETIRKVADAAHRIGYHARWLIDRNLNSSLPRMTFGFVLHKERQEFYRNFAGHIERAVAARPDIRGKVLVRFSASQSAKGFLDEIGAIAPHVDAIASSAINHHAVTREVQRLKDAGIPTFALLNDFAQGVRATYLGLNNMQVGRLAAWMLTKAVARPGKLALFVGGSRWHGHQLRETGFRSFVRDSAQDFTVVETLVNLETRQLTYEATLDLLSRQPDLRGIYVAGGGMEGAVEALRELRPPDKVALVVNELTDESRLGLADRYVTMVIATPLEELCRDLVEMMVSAVRSGTRAQSGQHFLPPAIHLPESF